MADPREVGKLFFEIRIDGLDQFRERRHGTRSASLFERKDPFDPSVSLVALGSIAPLTPEYTEAYSAFSSVVGGLDAVFLQKDPEGIHLLDEKPSEHASVILAVFVVEHKTNKSGVECVPLASVGRRFRPPAKQTQFREGPLTEATKGLILSLRKAFGAPDVMGQTGLPELCPVPVDAVIVADQNAFPSSDKLQKGVFGAMGMDHKISHRGIY